MPAPVNDFHFLASKNVAVEKLMEILEVPFAEGVRRAKNILFFDFLAENDPLEAMRVYEMAADALLEEQVEEASLSGDARDIAEKVAVATRDMMLSGLLDLRANAPLVTEPYVTLFEREMDKRGEEYKKQGISLLKGGRLESRDVATAITLVNALVEDSIAYRRYSSRLLESVKASLLREASGELINITLAHMLPIDSEEVEAMVEGSLMSTRLSLQAATLPISKMVTYLSESLATSGSKK